MENQPLRQISKKIGSSHAGIKLRQWIRQSDTETLNITEATGSVRSFLIYHLWECSESTILCLLPDADGALYLHADLSQLTNQSGDLLLFPPSGRMPYDQEQVAHSRRLVQRADVLQQLSDEFKGILVTSIPAVVERTPARTSVISASQTLKVGKTISPSALIKQLSTQGFSRVRFIVAPGEIAWRGGIVDIFSYSGGYPVRLEFLGDEIESIREFDSRTQRSISDLDQVRIVPRLEKFDETESRYASLFDFLPENTCQVLYDSKLYEEAAEEQFGKAAHRYKQLPNPAVFAPPKGRFLNGRTLLTSLDSRRKLHFGNFSETATGDRLSVLSRPQPAFNRNMDMLREHLADSAKRRRHTYIACDSNGQKERLADLLESSLQEGYLDLILASLHRGFQLPAAGVAVYTDHELFGRQHRPSTRKVRKKGGIRLHELRRLSPGDYVVHTDYGIGTFAGFRNITVRGRQQEAVRIHYAKGDVLYVNVNALYKLSKYSGKEGHKPKLTTLGTGQWQRSKRKAKKRLKDIARELIKLYAKRKASIGHRFPQIPPGNESWKPPFPLKTPPINIPRPKQSNETWKPGRPWTDSSVETWASAKLKSPSGLLLKQRKMENRWRYWCLPQYWHDNTTIPLHDGWSLFPYG